MYNAIAIGILLLSSSYLAFRIWRLSKSRSRISDYISKQLSQDKKQRLDDIKYGQDDH